MSKLKKLEYKNNSEHVVDEMTEFTADKSSNISIIKIGKDKFISIFNKNPKSEIKKIKHEIKENKTYDLNDYDYDCSDF